MKSSPDARICCSLWGVYAASYLVAPERIKIRQQEVRATISRPFELQFRTQHPSYCICSVHQTVLDPCSFYISTFSVTKHASLIFEPVVRYQYPPPPQQRYDDALRRHCVEPSQQTAALLIAYQWIIFYIISSRPFVVLPYMNNYLWQILFVLHCELVLHWVHEPSLQLLK